MFASSSESNAMLASSSESNALSAPSPQMVNNTARSSQGRFQLCSLRVALSQVASVGEADQQDLEIMRQSWNQYPDLLFLALACNRRSQSAHVNDTARYMHNACLHHGGRNLLTLMTTRLFISYTCDSWTRSHCIDAQCRQGRCRLEICLLQCI